MRQLAFVALLVVGSAGLASAHGLRTAFVELDEVDPGHATLHLRLTVPDESLSVRVDGRCSLEWDQSAAARDRSARLACSDGLVAGHELVLEGLGPVLSDAVVWARYADGTTQSRVLTRDDPSWVLPIATSARTVIVEYVRLGVVHILTGWDHLLFLLLLVLTLRTPRRVLWAETAFTLSHSLSFTATALGLIRVSAPAAEACIALSLVLVALDVGRDERMPTRFGGPTLAFVFGLVHGLGFAGGLREIGLPERDVAAALVSFGVGVELGQIAFLAVVLSIAHLVSRARVWPRLVVASAYASGAVATAWLIERLSKCFLLS